MRAAQTRFAGALVALTVLSLAAGACAARSASVGEVKVNPGRYIDRSISIEGVVTESWGVPLVPYKLYKVDDGTGEITVVTDDDRIPSKGARVRVRGKLQDVATLGGRTLGLHLRQEDVDYRDNFRD
jgi:hypothetical protein